jgi:hypothetical protein
MSNKEVHFKTAEKYDKLEFMRPTNHYDIFIFVSKNRNNRFL